MKKNLKKAMAMGLATTMALAAPAAVSAAGNTSDVIWFPCIYVQIRR